MWEVVAAIGRVSKILFYFAFPLKTGLLIQPLNYSQIFFSKFILEESLCSAPKEKLGMNL